MEWSKVFLLTSFFFCLSIEALLADPLIDLTSALEQLQRASATTTKQEIKKTETTNERDVRLFAQNQDILALLSEEARQVFDKNSYIRILVYQELSSPWKQLYRRDNFLTDFVFFLKGNKGQVAELARDYAIEYALDRILARLQVRQDTVFLYNFLKELNVSPIGFEALLTNQAMIVAVVSLFGQKKIQDLEDLFAEARGETATSYANSFNAAYEKKHVVGRRLPPQPEQ